MKRPLSHRLFSALLALLVLSASVGLTVLQHTCRQSGHRTAAVIFNTPQHRCPAPKPAPAAPHHATHSTQAELKGACCDFQTHLHKLDVPSPELTWAKLLMPPLVADWLPMELWPALPPVPTVARAAAWHAADSSPPGHRAGRELLTFIRVLVV